MGISLWFILFNECRLHKLNDYNFKLKYLFVIYSIFYNLIFLAIIQLLIIIILIFHEFILIIPLKILNFVFDFQIFLTIILIHSFPKLFKNFLELVFHLTTEDLSFLISINRIIIILLFNLVTLFPLK